MQDLLSAELPLAAHTITSVFEAINARFNDGVIYQDSEGNPLLAFCATASVAADLIQLQTLLKSHTYLIALGFFTYDAIRLTENIPDRHGEGIFPPFYFGFYNITITFYPAENRLVVRVLSDQAQTVLDTLTTLLQAAKPLPTHAAVLAPLSVDISDEAFMEKIKQAQDYIVAGDAFQIVLSRAFKQPIAVNSLSIYAAMLQVCPAPFMFYFPTPYATILGASPERYIQVKNNIITLNPIAGTRQRLNASQDDAITTSLLNDEKECAEHTMLVDLARNDIGRVAKPGTVAVQEFMQVKHYPHISHITSTVTGELRKNLTAIDAFLAAFPAGTLSGAPKIRAMEIIDELETSKRGLYGGAICSIDSEGNLDSCIAIRMATIKDNVASIRAGAGIVYDSKPLSEAQETRIKAQSMLTAIAHAHGVVP